MKLNFKFDEYYEILDDYENLLSKFEPRFTSIPGDENSIGLSPIRVVIPSLHGLQSLSRLKILKFPK